MANHVLVYQAAQSDASNAMFTCTACGKFFGFNKPGVGSPTAIASGPPGNPTYTPPDTWPTDTGACDQGVSLQTVATDHERRIAALERKVP
jgi:hypothetical protein